MATVYAGKPTLGALDQHWSKQNCPQQFNDESAQISSRFVFVIVFYWVFLEFLDLGSIGVFGFICYGLARRFMYVIVFFVFVIMC